MRFLLTLLALALLAPATASAQYTGRWLDLGGNLASSSVNAGEVRVYNWTASLHSTNTQPQVIRFNAKTRLFYDADGSAVTVKVTQCRGSDPATCSKTIKVDRDGNNIVDANDPDSLDGQDGTSGVKNDEFVGIYPGHYLVAFNGDPGGTTPRVRIDAALD